MSDEESIKHEVDGIQANGVNAFTSSKFGLALVIKPNLTAGDVERWLKDIRIVTDQPMPVLRVQLLQAAAKAALIVHSTDPIGPDLDYLKAQWYGAQLWSVYWKIVTIDPN